MGDLLHDQMPNTNKLSVVTCQQIRDDNILPMSFYNPLYYISIFVRPLEKIRFLFTVQPTKKTIQGNFGISTDNWGTICQSQRFESILEE